MAEEIVLSLQIENSDAGRSLKSLKEEFRNTQKELDGLTVGSQKYVDTLKKLGAVKDEINDLNQTINAFNPEGKVQALGNALGGVASGFQAATAATALFGTESEDLNKTLVKVQAAMALTDAIKGVTSLKDSWVVLNAIISANPIAAVTVAVIGLTGAVAALISEQDKELEQLKKQADERAKLRGKTRDAELSLAAFKRKLKTDELEQDLNVARAKGENENVLYNLERNLLKQRLADIAFLKREQGNLTKEQALEKIQLNNQLEILEAEHQKNILDKKKKANEDAAKAAAKLAEDEAKAAAKLAEDEAAIQTALEDKFANEESEKIKKRTEFENENLKLKAENQQKINNAIAKSNVEAQKFTADELAKIEAEKIATQMAAMNALANLSQAVFAIRLSTVKKGSEEEQKILKKQFEINKAFQLAQAAMAGAQSILAITSVPDFTLGVATATRIGIQVATTAAQIAKIASTQFNGGASTSSTSESGGTPTVGTLGATTAPNITNPQATQLNPDGTIVNQQPQNAQTNQRVYVVETDITNTQSNVNKIKDRATVS